MSTNSSIPSDFAAHLERLRSLPRYPDASLRTLFEPGMPIFSARAPGRLDVMGGIADYSGSVVLEMPIAEAAFAAVQVVRDRGVTIASVQSDGVTALVTTIGEHDWAELVSGDLESARAFFGAYPHSAWAAYVAGPLLVLLQERQATVKCGLRILIDSSVPEGKGVSSSAAVEVATMRALAAGLGIAVSGEKLAGLCQVAENLVAGAPCGIMDQMTSALGRENELLALRCQPAIVEGFVSIPQEIAFWGIDSGVRHSVGGSDYSSVRCGAFMGYRIVADGAGLAVKPASGRTRAVEIDDPHWNGYLANLAPGEFWDRFAARVPDCMSGSDFLERYAGTTDQVTRVDPGRNYAVLPTTAHPIGENQRVGDFRALLRNRIDEKTLNAMGELMYAAHDSYTACGLGSEATDALVKLVKEARPTSGLYGAKITGGGSGGTVAILGCADAEQAVADVARRYAEHTGRETYIFRGSSPGAYGTPVQQVVI
jgi:L-arabinokinase